MVKKEVNLKLLFSIFLLGFFLWNLETPRGLETNAWHIFIIFIMTIIGIITSTMAMGAVTLTAIAVLVLTKTLPLNNALSGFASPIAWLVVVAFFIARGFIKTNLGKRIAYILISQFGKSNIGLSYSLIFTEFLLAPMIPSTSARGGGIIYPIAKSLADEYDKNAQRKSRTSAFLIATCFHTNVICCALFLTSMAGNPLIASLAKTLGIEITWTNWALATIIPGLLNLILLPYIVSIVAPPEKENNTQIAHNAHIALKNMGGLSRNEIIMLLTFALMLFLWVFGGYIGIDATTSGIIGFLILVVTEVIKWDEVVAEKSAWETLIWFASLLMLSEFLTKFGVDKWVENNITYIIGDFSGPVIIAILGAIYFYIHYLFASITAHVTVMYVTFLIILMKLGLPPLIAGMGLAILSNLSGGLTHYGINSAPIYFSAGYFSTREWFKLGIVVASLNLLIWTFIGGFWWKIIGWW